MLSTVSLETKEVKRRGWGGGGEELEEQGLCFQETESMSLGGLSQGQRPAPRTPRAR